MKPAPFQYHRASTVDDAITLLGELGEDAKIVSGGQSLVPMMSFRLARPAHLVDIGRIADLDEIEIDGERLTIGALTTHQNVMESMTIRKSPGHRLLSETMRHVGHLPIRTRGTMGGSIAHADGAAEWPLLAVLFAAVIIAEGPQGRREIDAADFFFGLYTTSLEPEEMITHVVFPAGSPQAGFAEYGLRHGDFALASAGVLLGEDTARVVVGGAAPAPSRMPSVEATLSGGGRDEAAVRAAAQEDLDFLDAEPDPYQRGLVTAMILRAVQEASSR